MSILRRISLRLLAKLISSRSVSARSSSPSYPSIIPSSISRACWSSGNNPSIAWRKASASSSAMRLCSALILESRGSDRALRNGARLHNGNDINLVLNLVDLTVGDAADHFRQEPHRVHVRGATSIFRSARQKASCRSSSASRGQTRSSTFQPLCAAESIARP